MPKDRSIQSVLVIGSGPIVIGQACEFDYSGTQAIKALKKEGLRVSLVNSNPATIMTDPEYADRTYVEPLTPEAVAAILERERPDALLPTVGGQTALNLAVELSRRGVLDRLGIRLIGASRQAVEIGEDRKLFKEAMGRIGLEVPRSSVARSLEEAQRAVADTGLPAVIRPSFTMGGSGGGIAYNHEEFEDLVDRGLDLSPVHEVLIEESVIGWKEYELEVMRDRADNFVVICSIENFDPMGIHTGDSVTVAPAQTLTDREYQVMRNAARAIIREVGVETGGSNIQFAVDPKTGRLVVIEMNPRVSRSSALASKATGFPIAKIAALLAIGYHLDEIQNDITRVTPACFEPVLDYVVVKIPRWAFEKFPDAAPTLGTQMKSVGEVMAIGRTFKEALHKGLRGLETGISGFARQDLDDGRIKEKLLTADPDRIFYVKRALDLGWTHAEIYRVTGIDPWFLDQMQQIVDLERQLGPGLLDDPVLMREAKRMGFSDVRLGQLARAKEGEVRARRKAAGIVPVYKRVDTCAGRVRVAHPLPLLDLRARRRVRPHGPPQGGDPGQRAQPHRAGHRVRLLLLPRLLRLQGGGVRDHHGQLQPGDGLHRLRHLRPSLLRAPLLRGRDEHRREGEARGRGHPVRRPDPPAPGRAPAQAGVKILGTSPDAVDLAEDRKRFSALLRELDIPQPESGTATSLEEAKVVAERIGYPVLVRPSYVLGGRAMAIVFDADHLEGYVREAVKASPEHPDPRRPLPRGRLRGRRGRPRRRRARGHRGDPAAHRGGGHPQRRLRDGPAHLQDRGPAPRDHQAPHPPPGPRPGREGPHERPVRDQGRRGLRARGQPPGLAHHALREQGHGGAPGQGGGEDHGRAEPGRAGPHRGPHGLALLREGVGLPLPEVPGGRHPPRARDEVDGRGHGHLGGPRHRLRQVADGLGLQDPHRGHGLHLVNDFDKGGMLPHARELARMGFHILATRGTAEFLGREGVAAEMVYKVNEGRPERGGPHQGRHASPSCSTPRSARSRSSTTGPSARAPPCTACCA